MEKKHRIRPCVFPVPPCVFPNISIGFEDPIYAHLRVLTAPNLLASFAGLTLIFSVLRIFSYGSHNVVQLGTICIWMCAHSAKVISWCVCARVCGFISCLWGSSSRDLLFIHLPWPCLPHIDTRECLSRTSGNGPLATSILPQAHRREACGTRSTNKHP